MVDYVAVLRRTIDALPKNTPEIRERVYAKARATVESKLAMINPPPSQALIAKQMSGLEAAIARLEADFIVAQEPESVPQPQEADPLMDVLRGLPNVANAPAPAPRHEDVADADLPQIEDTRFDRSVAAAPPVSAAPDFPDEAEIPRLPNTASFQFDERPRTTDNFDDVFGNQNSGQASDPFVAPTLDDPVLPPVFARPARAKAKPGRLLVPLLGLAVLGGAGALAWIERDRIIALLQPEQVPAVDAQPTTEPPTPPATEAPAQSTETPAAPASDAVQKFTQRLNEDGTEVDAGAGVASGEQSVAQLQPAETPANPAAPATETPATETPAVDTPVTETPATETPATEPILVGQKAIFYEERTSGSEGSARTGDVVWSVVRESPGNDRPPEPAVRG
ncbi:MAG: hypothetical protein ACRCT6_09955, partial [Notoacmeibacter sp.]